MKKYDLISGLAWLAVGVLFCIGSIGLGLGDINEPGPGFFPFCMSVCLISFSSIHFIYSLKKPGALNFAIDKRFWPETDGMKRILFTIISLFIFVIALSYIGFVLTTMLFMVFVSRFIEPQKWFTVFLLTSLTTCLSYSIFQLWLKANLPVGFLGF